MNRKLYALNRIQNFYGFTVKEMELPRNMFRNREDETSLVEFIKGPQAELIKRAPWETREKLALLEKIARAEEKDHSELSATAVAAILAIPVLMKYVRAIIPPKMSNDDSDKFLFEEKEDDYVGLLLSALHINPTLVSDEDMASLKEILEDIYTRRDIAFFVM